MSDERFIGNKFNHKLYLIKDTVSGRDILALEANGGS
jgi:hypothetical protein